MKRTIANASSIPIPQRMYSERADPFFTGSGTLADPHLEVPVADHLVLKQFFGRFVLNPIPVQQPYEPVGQRHLPSESEDASCPRYVAQSLRTSPDRGARRTGSAAVAV